MKVSRRRLLVVFAHSLTAAGHVVPAAALNTVLNFWAAVALTLVLWFLTARRLRTLASDPRRPRWVVRLWDEPVSCHWAACVFALPLFVLGGLVLVTFRGLGMPPVPSPFGAGSAGLSELGLWAYGVGFLLSAWGVWGERRRLLVHTLELPIAGLDPELDGLRVAHLSDLHIGGFDSIVQGKRWVERANALEPDIVAVTGDLVTSGTHWYGDAAEVIGRLRGRHGVFVSLGNHDQWDAPKLVTALEQTGVRVLRNSWQLVGAEQSAIVVAGLDDRYTKRDDLARTLRGRPSGVPTLLLAHYPESFDAAASHEVTLVLSGHTHGGQIGVPFFAERLHLGMLTRQASRGLYHRGESTLHVSAGLGTTGLPLRLGIPPEITLFILRSESPNARSSAPRAALS
jgi:predicted MPP superfamily phosphohydrolase